MKAALVELVLLLGGLAVAGFVVAASGIVPVRASAGHSPPVRWFLSFAMERSISTWANLTTGAAVLDDPTLDRPALVLRGAGHYETGCLPCHGAPGRARSEIALELTPEPPYLPDAMAQWERDELFQLVKHGIKMTGMPAWPARERDDEVWAVVAFLESLPELSPAGYRELALGGDGDAADPLLATCARCHGTDGGGRGPGAFPKLAGQTAEYLAASLVAYGLGIRHSGIMEPHASPLDETAVRELARWYAELDADASASAAAEATSTAPDPEALLRGEAVARRGVPERKVPACVHCHGPATHPLNPRYPRLAGQHADYLALQLRLFAADRRGGTLGYGHVMSVVVRGLTDAEMRDVAAWYASLPPGDPDASPSAAITPRAATPGG